MLNFLTEFPLFYLSLSLVFGLAVGSFLNVVIYRLPLMMQAGWRRECYEFLQLEGQQEPALDLMLPRSHCPQCQKPLRSWHNIPLLSYLFLGGKCAYCKTAIHWRYPFIELLTGLLSLFVAAHYGPNLQMLAVQLFTFCLLALTFIDFDHQLLPDTITLPLLWLGLLLNIDATFVSLPEAVIGAAAGYLSLWSVAKIFERLTGKVGMGGGDFKLLALLGAWLGWQILPLIILLASAVGAIVGISLMLFKKHGRDVPIPFGPYLAIAGWLGLVFGDYSSAIYSWLL